MYQFKSFLYMSKSKNIRNQNASNYLLLLTRYIQITLYSLNFHNQCSNHTLRESYIFVHAIYSRRLKVTKNLGNLYIVLIKMTTTNDEAVFN